MKNNTLYLVACVISIGLILPAVFYNDGITSALSGIGCSVLAASIMAIFLENADSKREKKRLMNARQIYFNEINSQFTMMIGRLLWFEERLEEGDFDWDLDPDEYSSLKFMLYSQRFSQGKVVSFQEAESRLVEMGKKYNFENIQELSQEQRLKVQKMFVIIAASSLHLLREVKAVNNNKLLLDVEEIISIKEIEQLIFNISLAIAIMQKADKNYEAGIKLLLSAAKKIREIGGYNDSVNIALQGSIETSEI